MESPEEDFVRSLSHCVNWQARGGKSGAVFYATEGYIRYITDKCHYYCCNQDQSQSGTVNLTSKHTSYEDVTLLAITPKS